MAGTGDRLGGLRAQAQPAGTRLPRTLLEHRAAGGPQKAPREPVAPKPPPFPEESAPSVLRAVPGATHTPQAWPSPAPSPRDPLQPPCPARAPRSRAWIPSAARGTHRAALTSRGFPSPSPTGQGAKTWEEPPVASAGPSCPQICPTAPWQRHCHLQGHVQTAGMEQEAAQGSAVTGTKLFLPRALPTGIVTKGAVPVAQLWCRSLGAAPQKRT